MADVPTPYQSYLGLGSLIDSYSEDWLADDSESEEAWLTPTKMAANFSSSAHRQSHYMLTPGSRIDAGPEQLFVTPKKPDGSQKHTADSSLHQNGASFQTQHQTTSDFIPSAESNKQQAANSHSATSNNGISKQSNDACYCDSIASSVTPCTTSDFSKLASADSHGEDQPSILEYSSIKESVSSITPSNERSAASPIKEIVLSHGTDNYAISQHSPPGNTAVSMISIERSNGHLGPAQTQDERPSLAQGWALCTSDGSSRRAEDSATSSLDPYLIRHICLKELELLWEDDCIKGHGGRKSSTAIAGKQTQDVVRSLEHAGLLGKLRSAVHNVDEQLAAMMADMCDTEERLEREAAELDMQWKRLQCYLCQGAV